MNANKSGIRFTLILTALLMIGLPAAAPAAGSEGSLAQKAGNQACTTDDNTVAGVTTCADGVGLNGTDSVTVSPDGKSAYVASAVGAVAVFDRDTTTGALTQKTGPAACIADDNTVAGVTTCADGVGLDFATSVTVSPDGKSAYVASFMSSAVAVFDRDTTTGALTQKAGTDACVSETGSSGDCADGVGLVAAWSVTVSPDGKNAYVASPSSAAVAVFDRNTTTGALTQKAGTEACVSETGSGGDCENGVGLDGARSVTVSPDGKSAYVASSNSDTVAVFDRDATTGALTQKTGPAACIADDNTVAGVTTCADGVGLNEPRSVTVSPDGKSAYVASATSSAVAVFDRDTTTGALTQKAGTEACVSETGSGGNCADGVGLAAPHSVTVSPDGRSAYVASRDSSAVAVFDRDTTTGALTHKAGIEACVSETGSSGACADGVGLDDAYSVTVSPDGRNAYVASFNSDAVAVFDRTPDTTAPDTQIDSGPTGTITTDQATFTFSGDPASDTNKIQCRIDSEPFADCTSPKTFTGLSDGPHTATFRAEDAAGNQDPTPATRSFTVDTTAPDTQIDSGPTGTITTDQASFTFSGDPASDTNKIQCRIDSEPFADCTSPKTFTGLSDGPHTATFRAEDAAGNQDPTPATRSFTVDTTAPDTTIDSGPTGTITTDQASFTFSGDPASDTNKIQCRIDSEPFADCTSPKTFTGLSDGPHTATFRAEDAAGNQDPTPATRTFTIDTTVDPPVVDPPVVDPPVDPTVDPPVGKAKIGKVKVKGPAKVKKGKKATYKVKVTNSGNAAATGVKLKVKGKGIKAKKSVGKIAAGKTKTVKVKVKPKKPGKVKLKFKVTSKNAGGKTVKRKIRVRK